MPLCHGIQATAMCSIADDFFDELESILDTINLVHGYANEVTKTHNISSLPIGIMGIINKYIDFVGSKDVAFSKKCVYLLSCVFRGGIKYALRDEIYSKHLWNVFIECEKIYFGA